MAYVKNIFGILEIYLAYIEPTISEIGHTFGVPYAYMQ